MRDEKEGKVLMLFIYRGIYRAASVVLAISCMSENSRQSAGFHGQLRMRNVLDGDDNKARKEVKRSYS